MSDMEMPEGWNKLVSDKGPGLNDSQLAREIDFAMGLMKEMAEALEAYIEAIADECVHDPEQMKLECTALQKFKEWK